MQKYTRANSTQVDVIQTNQSPKWRKILFGARTQILFWYVVLMASSALVSILAIRQALLTRLQEDVEKSLVRQVEEFRSLTKGRNPTTAQPFGDDVAAIFDVFLSRHIPDEDEFLIALLNGQFYKSSPTALPVPIHSDSALIKQWTQLTQPQQGKAVTTASTILFVAEPIIRGKTQGVFVVVHSNSSDRQHVDEAVVVVIQVTMAVLAVASVLAWIVAGRVLAPLRLLTETAHSISESDLTQRILIKGSDEIAELTITFNEMLDRLQAAFSSQRDFMNDAGHELKTPITIIRGHLELLGDDPQERRETLELVIDELDRMSRIVDDLLLLAKAKQPDFLTLEKVEIGLLTEEMFAKAKALAVRDWRLETKGLGSLNADRHRITQAIMQLAKNATQHTTSGDAIALGSSLRDGRACFWVRDTGEGIPLSDQQRIFERFARGSSGSSSLGVGLGLSIVRAIALSHGGWVELLSRPSHGSTFTIVLPVEPLLERMKDQG